jgi:hypothetical protein
MLTMWVTEDEHRRLLERCDGRQLAAWMRQTCLDEKPARTGKLYLAGAAAPACRHGQ